MRKVIVTEYISLDGVIEEPSWTAPYWHDDIAKFKFDELFESDALLLGRVTYEGFAKAWPTMLDEQGFGARMNSLPKFVASRTLDKMEWNANPIKGDLVEEVNKLKAQEGMNLLVYGSGNFVDTLLQNNLVDELRLVVYPVVLGKGQRLFKDGRNTTLTLVEAKPLSPEVVALIYRLATPPSKE